MAECCVRSYTGIARCACRHGTEGDCKRDDASFHLYFAEHEGEALASVLTTPPTAVTENGSLGFGFFTDYVFTFFRIPVRLCSDETHNMFNKIQRNTVESPK